MKILHENFTIKHKRLMRILVLGHNGLLGNMVLKYLLLNLDNIITTNFRWETEDFKNFIITSNSDFIINCIGAIPQKNRNDYEKVNYKLPLWLDSLNIKIIHPDTDEPNDTPYGLSKEKSRQNCNKNTKIIKTSIIGFEKNTTFSFLEWFLNEKDSVNGFINHFWNGNTTLEWAKFANKMINNWYDFKHTTTIANPDCNSKYQMLLLFKNIFKKDIIINKFKSKINKNNCLEPDFYTKKIKDQIIEMKNFYKN